MGFIFGYYAELVGSSPAYLSQDRWDLSVSANWLACDRLGQFVGE
jgi:hypothetical protein